MLVPPVEDGTGLVSMLALETRSSYYLFAKFPEFYPASGFQSPVSIPASTTSNRFLHLRFSD
jgi:hypothetical protein